LGVKLETYPSEAPYGVSLLKNLETLIGNIRLGGNNCKERTH